MLFDAEYNRENNPSKNAKIVRKRFDRLKGEGPWRTRELHDLGFTDRNIKTFVKRGHLRKIYQGLYIRGEEVTR